jgi:hypothetical protein
MRKLFLLPATLILTGISLVCEAQYTGGNDDGFSSGTLSGSVCTTPVNANIYFGGSSASSSSAALSTSVCAAPVNANIYFGGVQDGSSSATLAATVCPVPVNANIYFGGVEDGASSATLAATVCPIPVNANIYFGGVEDGSSSGKLAATICPIPVNANIYFGGVEDGASTGILAVTACPVPVNGNIFFGGVQDGFSAGMLTVAACPVPTNVNIYFGGSQDGFSSVYLKTLLATCLLPIELPSFTGDCSGGTRVLNWSTATESNNAYFTIEYSTDGVSWQAAGTVAGAGNSSTMRNYSFTDGALRPGTVYYRLRQTDLDGKSSYSSIISVGNCIVPGTDKLNIYPNPSPGQLILSFDGDKSKVQSIEVYDVLGERIYYSGGWQSSLDLSDKPSGTYFVHFITDGRTVIKEVVIKKD